LEHSFLMRITSFMAAFTLLLLSSYSTLLLAGACGLKSGSGVKRSALLMGLRQSGHSSGFWVSITRSIHGRQYTCEHLKKIKTNYYYVK
jgi:hypothetical protein